MKRSAKEVGVFLSLSSYEGMQMAVGEAFCGGGLGLTLNWRGARDAYPGEFVFDNVDELVEAIVNYLRERERYEAASARGRAYVQKTYSIERVWSDIERMIRTVRA
jgi:poly(ribitol-phosphate) beta-N-acetylglucosaminyltransferase